MFNGKTYYNQMILPPKIFNAIAKTNRGNGSTLPDASPGFVDLNGMDIMVHVNDCKPEDLEASSNILGQGWSIQRVPSGNDEHSY